MFIISGACQCQKLNTVVKTGLGAIIPLLPCISTDIDWIG